MPKIAASLVCPVSSVPRRNAVVEMDNNGMIISVSQGNASFREIAGVAYYSGILIPGLTDVMCDPMADPHWLLSRGIRVAGTTSLPNAVSTVSKRAEEGLPDVTADKSVCRGGPGRNGVTSCVSWKSIYGGVVDYVVFDSAAGFREHFRTGEHRGLFYSVEGGGMPVLASEGFGDMIGLMLELQQGPARLGLAEILVMAALNGSLVLGCEESAGTISPGRRPGLNIIEGADIAHMKLLPSSRLKRLF
jgi:hypothetical protein